MGGHGQSQSSEPGGPVHLVIPRQYAQARASLYLLPGKATLARSSAAGSAQRRVRFLELHARALAAAFFLN
jgi:hypothetical protein